MAPKPHDGPDSRGRKRCPRCELRRNYPDTQRVCKPCATDIRESVLQAEYLLAAAQIRARAARAEAKKYLAGPVAAGTSRRRPAS